MNSIKLDQAIAQQLFQILSKTSLESLKAGTILQGKVQALENGLLFIKLLDGASFTAKVPEDFSASVGESITLEIGEKINDQITARIVQNENTQPNKNTEQLIIHPSIVKNLHELGVQPSEKLVQGVINLLKAEPSIPLEQASFLAANNMDTQPEMLKILQRISEQEFQLHNNLDTIKGQLIEGLSDKIITSGNTQAGNLLKTVMTSQSIDELINGSGLLLKYNNTEQNALVLNSIRELITKALMNYTEKNAAAIGDKGINDEILELVKSIGNESQLSPKDNETLQKSIPKIVQKCLDDIHTKSIAIDKGDNHEIEEVLNKLFEKATIKLDNGKLEDADIKDKVKALKEIMDFSNNALSNMDGKAQNATLPALKEIGEAFRFFNQVTTYDSMIQLPIKINQQNTTGELYVMKRKGSRKKLDPNNFTLFLSLQTMSLGRIESFMNASRKYITISFRVENEELTKLVKDNHRALYDSLLQKGYKLAEMKCRVLEKDTTNILNASQKTNENLGIEAKLDLKI